MFMLQPGTIGRATGSNPNLLKMCSRVVEDQPTISDLIISKNPEDG